MLKILLLKDVRTNGKNLHLSEILQFFKMKILFLTYTFVAILKNFIFKVKIFSFVWYNFDTILILT